MVERWSVPELGDAVTVDLVELSSLLHMYCLELRLGTGLQLGTRARAGAMVRGRGRVRVATGHQKVAHLSRLKLGLPWV